MAAATIVITAGLDHRAQELTRTITGLNGAINSHNLGPDIINLARQPTHLTEAPEPTHKR